MSTFDKVKVREALDRVVVVTATLDVNELTRDMKDIQVAIPYFLAGDVTVEDAAAIRELIVDHWTSLLQNDKLCNLDAPIAGSLRGYMPDMPARYAEFMCNTELCDMAYEVKLNPIRYATGEGCALWGSFIWINGSPALPSVYSASFASLKHLGIL